MEINITVKNKIAYSPDATIVCGNSDYTIKFAFDDEWETYTTKTARFSWGGQFEDIVFDGEICPVPVIRGVTICAVGVFAGDLHTTTPALVTCVKSILCGGGVPADPQPDVYAQIMEKLNEVNPGGGDGENGATFTPSVSADGVISWTNDKGLDNPEPVNIKGERGEKGEPGQPGEKGEPGQQGEPGKDGADGQPGANGQDGKDGVSCTHKWNGTTLSVTSASGTSSADLKGEKGDKGDKGDTGATGATGEQGAKGDKGDPYTLTTTDKNEIAESVKASLTSETWTFELEDGSTVTREVLLK